MFVTMVVTMMTSKGCCVSSLVTTLANVYDTEFTTAAVIFEPLTVRMDLTVEMTTLTICIVTNIARSMVRYCWMFMYFIPPFPLYFFRCLPIADTHSLGSRHAGHSVPGLEKEKGEPHVACAYAAVPL